MIEPMTPATATDAKPSSFDSTRETIESIAVAFMLAFMFKTFLAEMFVIPTGSMAPTLQGRHYDLVCPECGEEYRCGFLEQSSVQKVPVCPNCRYALQLDPNNKNEQVFMGDRITVNKFLYDFDAPQRWDVIVFKYPEDAKTNYIKRLIGLPGEKLRIYKGDIYTAKLDGATVVGPDTIARKPNHQKLQAMLQLVYDTDHTHEGFLARGWPSRWADWSTEPTANGWAMSADGKTFKLPESATATTLRYRHFVPAQSDWKTYKDSDQPLKTPNPQLIKDDYAYNVSGPDTLTGMNWVGDLALRCDVKTTSAAGTLTFDLIKGGVRFLAEIDLSAGVARLKIPTVPNYAPPEAKVAWNASETHTILFANVDDQLTLLIDDKPVFYPAVTGYAHLNNDVESGTVAPIPGDTNPTDYSPIGVTVQGVAAEVTHLKVLRDVFYIARDEFHSALDQFEIPLLDEQNDDKDQFFMLGDNSPSSSDGRHWMKQKFVERRLLIGKAAFIYWPHSWPTEWGVSFKKFGVDFDIPFIPNFKRMRLIR
ncbi:MAG: signal peptidase I [Pirellulales bacterium]